MRAWIRNRRKARAARKAQEALDRLHGRNAVPSRHHRRSRFGGWGLGDSDGWGDVIGDAIGGLVEALFKIFD